MTTPRATQPPERLTLLGAIAVLVILSCMTPGTQLAAQENSAIPNTVDFDRSDMGNVIQQARLHYGQGIRHLKRAEKLAAKMTQAPTEEKRGDLDEKRLEAYESAAQELSEAISYSPDMTEAYAALGKAYRLLDKNEDALQVHATALERGKDLDNFRGWTESLLAMNQLGYATSAYASFLEPSPEYAGILMAGLKDWLAERQDDPGEFTPATIEKLAGWIEENEQ